LGNQRDWATAKLEEVMKHQSHADELLKRATWIHQDADRDLVQAMMTITQQVMTITQQSQDLKEI